MARLIQSKQIEGVVTASVIQGDFQASGDISASIISASQVIGVKYSDIEGTPNFIGGSGITITQVGDGYTFTNTGGGGGGDDTSDAVSILQINAYTASNDLVIQRFEQTTSSLQTQITSLSSSLSGIEVGTTDFSELTGVPSGIVSSSVQILGGSDVVSGSVLRTLDGTNVLSGSKTDITELNQFTSSIQTQVDALIASTSSYLTSETDSQTLTIVGDQLTISGGNTITIPTGSSGGGGVSSWTELTDIPTGLISGSSQITDGSDIVSGSVLRTLDGTGVLSGSHTDISHLNTFTESIDTRVSSLESFSSSLDTTFATDSDLTNLSASITTTIESIVNTSIPQGTISSSQQVIDSLPSGLISSSDQILGGSGILSGSHTDISNLNTYTSSNDDRLSRIEAATGSYLTSETDSQTISIVGDQLTISSGNTITIPTGSSLPSGVVSGSTQITDGSGILSGSHTDITQLNQFTSSYLTDSASFDTRIDGIGGGDTSFDGDRVVSNTLLGDLYSQTFNAGTSGSLSEFIEQVFFPSYAPTATFSTQTSNLNTNLAVANTNIESFTITDTDSDTPYSTTISGTNGSLFKLVPQNANSSSWEIQPISDLSAGSYTYDIQITDSNSDTQTYSGRSITIAQAGSGTLSTTGTLYIIESAQSGPIYLGSSGRSGAQGGVSVSYSPNYGSQAATSFTSSNPLISINSSTGVLSVGNSISGSGNLSGSTITSTIGWTDQYGNTNTSDISVNVRQNNAPDIIFTNSNRLNTNQAIDGGGTLVTITFSDTEGDSINHDAFQFTDVSGQLTATKSGNNYLVTADNNLSGSTTYTIGATIEDTHGFRSNTESHSFTIVQGGIGTINGDTTMYIIESALTNASFRDATGFSNGNTAQVGVTYSPAAGSQNVQSFSSSNPSILINSSGNMTLGVDISGSVTQSGDTIQTLITFQDQYGNIGSGSVTANVFGNNAPSVTFVPTSDYDTDGSIANSNAGVITITDTEANSPYNVTLGGTNGSLFNAVPQNVASSSWQVQPKDSLTADTYSIDISVTDNYGESSTLSNKSIVVDAVASGETLYIYANSLGPAGGWADATYNGVMGISSVNDQIPPGIIGFTSVTSTLSTISTTDVLGDSTITTNGGSGTLTLIETLTNVTDLDTALANAGSITAATSGQLFLMYPNSDNLTTPTTIQETINGTSGGVVPYFNIDGGGWNIESATVHMIYVETAHAGHNNWFVLGRKGTNGISSNVQIRLINANGGSAPT